MTEETKQLKTDSPNQSNLGTGQAKGIAKAMAYIKEALGKSGKEGDIVKAIKQKDGWEVEIEVVEQSKYMQRIGITKPV
ncbi:MAG: hypothetical protein AAB606_01060, partial [Patescibacteria group bacterium]